MTERRFTVATVVTLARMAFLPVLWAWAAEGRVAWVGYGVMASFAADVLDGQLARRLKQVTRLGARLDSVADAALLASTVVWLAWFCPELGQEPWRTASVLALATWLLEIAVGAVRFHRFLNLHLYSGKASGVAGVLFATWTLTAGFVPALYVLAFGVFTLANLEGIVLMLTRDEVDEHAGSVLLGEAVHAAR
jgi:phosphatidylglycerophosphate synthase